MHAPKACAARYRIQTITPVVIQSSNRTINRDSPDKISIESTLKMRLTSALRIKWSDVSPSIEVVSSQTVPISIPVGSKYSEVSGWFGEVVVDANDDAAKLLVAASRGPGLGGRTGLGFGRITVTKA